MPQVKAKDDAAQQRGEQEANDRRATAQREREAAGEARRTFDVVRDEARRVAQGLSESAREGARAQERLVETLSKQNEQLTQQLAAAATLYSDAVNETTSTLQAVMSSSSATAEGVQEISRTWINWLTRTVEAGTRASQEALRCSDLQQLGELQREFLRQRSEEWLDRNAEILRISSRMADDAVRALEQRRREHDAAE